MPYSSHPLEALKQNDRLIEREPQNPQHLIQRAECLRALRLFPEALAAYDAAAKLTPDDARILFNRAALRRSLGQLAQAELDYDRVIALQPHDYEAYLNRTALRTQSRASNHVSQLEALLGTGLHDAQGEVFIRFALAKEYEDLKGYSRAFSHLKRGAALRRKQLRYDVAVDVATADWIIEAFAKIESPRPEATTGVASAAAPIFIVGLPRSGSTLIDRILGSHSEVHSAGELHAFAMALVDAVRRHSGQEKLSRRELIFQSARVDPAALGLSYLRLASSDVPSQLRFIDKMPLNYLYVGLIRRALPQAKIIHVTRKPMAVGYAMYKTLFQDGYPFSYDLSELGQYYLAYHRLMNHWREALPGAIHEIAYEDLVADQVGETRKLLQHCGLEWQEACANFHLNAAAVITASASQVRQPIHAESLLQWQHYTQELSELSELLHRGGIDTQG